MLGITNKFNSSKVLTKITSKNRSTPRKKITN